MWTWVPWDASALSARWSTPTLHPHIYSLRYAWQVKEKGALLRQLGDSTIGIRRARLVDSWRGTAAAGEEARFLQGGVYGGRTRPPAPLNACTLHYGDASGVEGAQRAANNT